jgi:hypothetical protein
MNNGQQNTYCTSVRLHVLIVGGGGYWTIYIKTSRLLHL